MDEMNHILVDVHEPVHLEERIKKLGLVTERVPLEVGDYVIGNIVIERKTIDDFLGSITTHRLFDQLYKMKESGMRGVLMVIGRVPYWAKFKEPNWTAQVDNKIFVMRQVCFFSYGVWLVQVQTEEDFMIYIQDFWNRCTAKTQIPVAKKGSNPRQVKIFLLASIPGIGSKLATDLVEAYPRLIDLVTMEETALYELKVNGRRLGMKGKNIREAFYGA